MATVEKKYEALGRYVDAMIDAMVESGIDEKQLKVIAYTAGMKAKEWTNSSPENTEAMEETFRDRLQQAARDLEAAQSATKEGFPHA